MAGSTPEASVRFAEFDFDRQSGELWKAGVRVPLPDQPLRLLEVLLEQPGLVVSREHLRTRLWPADTFVDFEHGLNAAVKRLRDTLGDSAENPRFVETVPKRGYRFIAAIDRHASSGPAVTPAPAMTRRRAWLAAGIATALIATAMASWLLLDRTPAASTAEKPRRLTRITFDPGLQTDPTFSPDGKNIAYASNKAGNFDIWMQPVDGGPATQLTNDPANDTQPDWSPDGRRILFRSERDGGGVFVVYPADRHTERLTSSGYGPQWSPDGSMFAFGGGLFVETTSYVAQADGTDVKPVARESLFRPNRAMGWHPNGRLAFLYGHGGKVALETVAPPTWQAVAAEIAPDVRRQFETLPLTVVDHQRLAWSDDGRTLYFVGESNDSRDIWSLSVEPGTLRITSGPVRVTTGVEAELTPTFSRQRRMLAFGSSLRTTRVWVLGLDARGRSDGQAQPVTRPEYDASQPVLSRDGRRLVVFVQHPGGNGGCELREISLDEPVKERTIRRLDRTVERSECAEIPRLSPDGLQLVYSYRDFRPSGVHTAIRRLDLRSLEESPVTSLWNDGFFDNPWSWSADGRSVLASSNRYQKGFFSLVRLSLAAAPEAEKSAQVVLSSTNLRFWEADESRDGRWVCFNATTPEADNSAIYVVAAKGGTPTRVSTAKFWDDKPRWSPDGRLIYFVSVRSGDLNVWAIRFDRVLGRPVGEPFQVTRYSGPDGTIGSAELIGAADISITQSRMALPIQHLSGGIWIME